MFFVMLYSLFSFVVIQDSGNMENKIVIGTIDTSADSQKIAFFQSIDHSVFLNLENEISILEEYNSNKELYSIFLVNFIELSQYFQEAVDELVSKQVAILDNQREDFQIIYRNSNRLFLNLLSSGRTLIDHSETYLKRKYGINSNEINRFKTLLNKIYDENFEYRFIYKLRNYSQHCGLPINSLKYTIDNIIKENNYSSVAKLNPMFVKAQLLNKYKEWGKLVTDELKNKSDEFPVMPVIYEYYNCIEQIVETVKEIENYSLKKAISEIKKITDLFTDYNDTSQLCVFYDFEYSIPNSYENSKFTILTIPLNLINEINAKIKDSI
jgi:hypothetical protein